MELEHDVQIDGAGQFGDVSQFHDQVGSFVQVITCLYSQTGFGNQLSGFFYVCTL